MATYRNLTDTERERLRQNGCRCSNWALIHVKDGFNPCQYVRTCFSGEVYLGLTDRPVSDGTGPAMESGIFDSNINNCTIGDNVRIANVSDYLSNYIVGNGCYIANVGSITANPGASFGNGTRVNVLNETGGRTNIIYDRMSSQIAYMLTFYRHDTEFINALTGIIMRYAESMRADFGSIGDNAVITNCLSVEDVRIESGAKISGASRLVDGTVGVSAFIGPGVIAEHFIIQSQAVVDNASILKNTLVGQAARISNCFVSHDSLFFANCVMECGEAVSTFAGPHTVSMHKSSLLIGGYFSFFNAGSGTNQSNHLYKLGPMHQGVMGRGCKTASNSYVMWPARFGGFTLVSGCHYGHPDTSALPYSYALAQNGKTHIIPAANLKTVGTIRDLMKWGTRDARDSGMERYDIINYDNLSPVTTNGMYGAIAFLNEFDSCPTIAEQHRFHIEPTAIKKGKEYYAIGVEYFMGEAFVQRLFAIEPNTGSELRTQLAGNQEKAYQKWTDIAGMIAPSELLEELCTKVASGAIDSIESIESTLRAINDRYYDLKWAYVQENLVRCYKVSIDDMTPEIAISIINRWREAACALDRLRKEDAMKDFAPDMATGFGIDGDRECKEIDFKAVHGNPEENGVIVSVHKHYADALLDAHEMISRIKKTFAITD